MEVEEGRVRAIVSLGSNIEPRVEYLSRAVVSLAAYVPLFANAQHLAWSPNLINVVSDGCFVSPSWNVQRLFGEYRGKDVLDCRVDAPLFEPGEKNSDGSPMTAPSVAASAARTAEGAIVLNNGNVIAKNHVGKVLFGVRPNGKNAAAYCSDGCVIVNSIVGNGTRYVQIWDNTGKMIRTEAQPK